MADKGFLKKWNSYKVEDNITVSPQKSPIIAFSKYSTKNTKNQKK